MWLVGICEHGKISSALSGDLADTDEKREFVATSHRIEMRDFVRFEGRCKPCNDRYLTNCATAGIEP